MTVVRKWFSAGMVLIGIGLVYPASTASVQRVNPAPSRCYDKQVTSCVSQRIFPPYPGTPQNPGRVPPPADPAPGQTIVDTGEDRLAGFSRRPFDNFIIPAGGLYLDPLHDGPHYGIDYANPDDYLAGLPTYFHPIGPGYVAARSICTKCFIDSGWQGRVDSKAAEYNFGWGGLVLIETPYSPDVSIYVLYAHLNSNFVSLGDYVTPDQVIGVVGTTGYSEEVHLHVEVRYGAPGRFWKADFSQQETLDRWLSTMFANPAMLIFPENHWAFTRELDEWAARQTQASEIP
jgi:murein DD-endopeptidase MepM/ murein hydrolase activator NlpD